MTQPKCINLLDVFEHWYRITFEDGYDPANVPRRCLDPWLMRIPCRYGEISVAGGKTLCWSCDEHPKIRNRVAALDRVEILTVGDRDLTVHFDVTDFDLIAGIVRPKKKPGMSAAERVKRSIWMRNLNRQSPIKSRISDP